MKGLSGDGSKTEHSLISCETWSPCISLCKTYMSSLNATILIHKWGENRLFFINTAGTLFAQPHFDSGPNDLQIAFLAWRWSGKIKNIWEKSTNHSSHFLCKPPGARSAGDADSSHNYLGSNVIASSIINSILIHSLFWGCSHTCICKKNEYSTLTYYLLKMRTKMLDSGHRLVEPGAQWKPRSGGGASWGPGEVQQVQDEPVLPNSIQIVFSYVYPENCPLIIWPAGKDSSNKPPTDKDIQLPRGHGEGRSVVVLLSSIATCSSLQDHLNSH